MNEVYEKFYHYTKNEEIKQYVEVSEKPPSGMLWSSKDLKSNIPLYFNILMAMP